MKKVVGEIIDQLTPLMVDFPWQKGGMYAHWLSQQYHIVRHSTPMLALSCGRSINNPSYHKRCIEHLSEEKGHDKMLLNDLRITGFEIQSELASTRAFYATQYYQVEHVNPVSFLGYILFMEALAVFFGKEMLARAASGSRGITFLKLHAEEDEDHITKAYEIIQQLPEADQRDIELNLRLSARTYISMFQDLHLLSEPKRTRSAA